MKRGRRKVVMELDAQAPDVSVHEPALRHEVRAQMRSRISCRETTRPARLASTKRDALLDAAEASDRFPRSDLPVHDVDLDLRRSSSRGRIETSVPDARRLMTIERASSSSGENGTVMMSSTPRLNARRRVFRSPSRVRPRTGVVLRHIVFEEPSRRSRSSASSLSMSTTARCGRQSARTLSAPASVRTARTTKRPWFQRQLDEVDEQRLVVEHQRSPSVQP